MNQFIFILIFLVVFIGSDTTKDNRLKPSFPTIPTASISQTFGHLDHVGIDFKVKVGSAVYADLDGIIVQELVTERTYGRFLEIKHADGYVSLYGHLSEFKVKKYERVVSGQLIALSGGDPDDKIDGDGASSSAHLHWEVRPRGFTDTNKYNVNPIEYLMSFLQINYRIAIVNSDIGLNVRSAPDKNSVIIYSLYSKDIVQIIDERLEWVRLNSLRPEWVMEKWLNYTDSFCNIYQRE